MSNFYELLKKSKRNISRDLFYSEDDAQILYRMIQSYNENNPGASNSEIYQYFLNLFYKENSELVTLPSIRGDTIRYNTCKYLLENPEELKKAYEKIHEEEVNGKVSDYNPEVPYSSNRESAIRRVIQEVLHIIREDKNNLPEDFRRNAEIFFKSSRKHQREFKEKLSSSKKRDFEELRDLFEGNEVLQITKYLKKNDYRLYNDLREDYITTLLFLGEKFEEYGLFQKNYEDQKALLKKLGCTDLEYPLDIDLEDSISIKSLFTRENLSKIDTDKLSMLTAFWLNRYTKQLNSLNKSFAVINQLCLWNQIKSAIPDPKTGIIHIDIDKAELETTYVKLNFLHMLSKEVFSSAKRLGNVSTEIVETSNKKVLQVDVEPVLKRMEELYGADYKTYFYEQLPDINHDLITDLDDYRILENVISNTYRLKDMNLIAILSNLYHNNHKENWGIILEDRDFESSDKILIGIDVEGLNMPIRLHAKKSDVRDFVKGQTGTTIFPIYEGGEDFRLFGTHENIGTPVLMPLCKKQKECIPILEQKQMKGSSKQRFFSHLKYLADRSYYPEHLKVERIVKKKGKPPKKVKEKPPKRYIDLDSGEQFYLERNGERKPNVPLEERTR